jgi:hypothetical protein
LLLIFVEFVFVGAMGFIGGGRLVARFAAPGSGSPVLSGL